MWVWCTGCGALSCSTLSTARSGPPEPSAEDLTQLRFGSDMQPVLLPGCSRTRWTGTASLSSCSRKALCSGVGARVLRCAVLTWCMAVLTDGRVHPLLLHPEWRHHLPLHPPHHPARQGSTPIFTSRLLCVETKRRRKRRGACRGKGGN
eukprot:678882-Rhodomonas_salina.7